MVQREFFICTGDLIPEDNELRSPEFPLGETKGDWKTTTVIGPAKVIVKLEGCVDYTYNDARAVRDLAAREAQETAQIWLSVIGFMKGASYSTRISTIEDSAGCIRKLGPRPSFGSDGEDLGIEKTKENTRRIIQLSISNEHFRHALYDYVTALNFTPYSPFFLYRSLEALHQHYGGWDGMHQSLGTSESEIIRLTKTHADVIRHGKSLDEQQLQDAYLGHLEASKYVRDTLLAFLFKNSRSDLDS